MLFNFFFLLMSYPALVCPACFLAVLPFSALQCPSVTDVPCTALPCSAPPPNALQCPPPPRLVQCGVFPSYFLSCLVSASASLTLYFIIRDSHCPVVIFPCIKFQFSSFFHRVFLVASLLFVFHSKFCCYCEKVFRWQSQRLHYLHHYPADYTTPS